MINTRRLTTAETAERLGVKQETVYAYVSRGILSRQRSAQGSTFDAREVARLARSARHPSGPGTHHGLYDRGRTTGRGPDEEEPVFMTELTLIDSGRLYYRGSDAVQLSRSQTFEAVAEWLWTQQLSTRPWTAPPARGAARFAVDRLGPSVTPVERFMVAVLAIALGDELRHDLSPASVPIVGRTLLPALVEALPAVLAPPASSRTKGSSRATTPDVGSVSERLWPRLSRLPLTDARRAVLEAALVLVADHELAPSTLAVRVAAALRADPYAAVLSGLGPASGNWYAGSSGAPSEVENLLAEALGSGAQRAIGERLRRTGAAPHGFGMPLYPDGDPRGRELLSRLAEVDGPAERHRVVGRVTEVARDRGFPPPNVDLGLGALAFCSDMVAGAGQAISTLAKVAGWLAHVMEEYANPTRFRSRADYVGSRPEPLSAGSGAAASRAGAAGPAGTATS